MNTKEAAAAYRIIAEGFLHLAAAIDPASPSVRAQGEAAGRAVVAPARPDNDDVDEAEWMIPLEGEPAPVIGGAARITKPVVQMSDVVPEGSLTQCPKHHTKYLPSKFKQGQFYCPSDSDEEGWSNTKGKCQITPKSAVAWLRQHAEVPA